MKKVLSFAAILLMLASAFTCGKEDEKESTEIPLVETMWKLVGFVDAQANEMEMVPQNSDSYYTITFHQDSTFSGYTSVNLISGKYEITPGIDFFAIKVKMSTFALESPMGDKYVKCLDEVTSYTLSNDGLSLYYSSTNRLLFKPYDN
jgi:heat shock protein HslJ